MKVKAYEAKIITVNHCTSVFGIASMLFEYPVGGFMAMLACLGAVAVFRIRKK
jgi:hypothetical protein